MILTETERDLLRVLVLRLVPDKANFNDPKIRDLMRLYMKLGIKNG